MGQYETCQHRAVKTDGSVGDEIPKVSLESSVDEAGSSQFVFAEEKKQNRRSDAHSCDRSLFCRCCLSHEVASAPGVALSYICVRLDLHQHLLGDERAHLHH